MDIQSAKRHYRPAARCRPGHLSRLGPAFAGRRMAELYSPGATRSQPAGGGDWQRDIPRETARAINRNIFHRHRTRRIVVCVLPSSLAHLLPWPRLFRPLLLVAFSLLIPFLPPSPSVFIPFIRSARFLGYFHNDTLCNVNYCRRNELEEVFQDAASRHSPLAIRLPSLLLPRSLVFAISHSLALLSTLHRYLSPFH